MKRKVNRVGQNTLTVSLPVGWVRENNVAVGDELTVDVEGPSLVVSKDKIRAYKSVDVHFTKESRRYIRSYLGRLYRNGHSTIRISFDDSALLKTIKEATSNLIGADIIDMDKKVCTVKVFPVEEGTTDTDKYLARMFNTLRYMFGMVREDVETGMFSREEDLTELRNNNWKVMDYLLRRTFLQKLPYDQASALNIMLFAYEKIGTNLLGFYRMYLESANPKVNTRKLKPVFDRIDAALDWFMKVLANKDPISPSRESRFRKEMRDFHIFLYNELHSDKDIDHPFLTMVYFTIELMDSTVSYLHTYKIGGS